MLMMLVRLGTGPADAHDAGPPLLPSQRTGLWTAPADAHDAGEARDSFYRKGRTG